MSGEVHPRFPPESVAEPLEDRLLAVLVDAGLAHRLAWIEIDNLITVLDRWSWLASQRRWLVYRRLAGAMPRAEFEQGLRAERAS